MLVIISICGTRYLPVCFEVADEVTLLALRAILREGINGFAQEIIMRKLRVFVWTWICINIFSNFAFL